MRVSPFGRMAVAAAMLMALTGVTSALPATVKLSPNRDGWSETVGGLRVKAIADQPVFTLGDDLHLLVMIHNTTDQPIEMPGLTIMPTAGLAEDEHPFEKDHSFNAMVIGRPAGGAMCILWAKQAMLMHEEQMQRIEPNGVHPVVIRLNTGFAAMMALRAFDDDVTRADVALAAAVGAGDYELTFVFDTGGLVKDGRPVVERMGPAVRLQTPPIIVTARERADEAAQQLVEPANAVQLKPQLAPKNDGWTDTFHGLRLKAVVSDLAFDLGDDVVLFVMMHNTTDQRLTIPEPRVTPQTRAPHAGQAGDNERFKAPRGRGFNAHLTAEPDEARAEPRHGGLEPIAEEPELVILEPESVILEPDGIHVLIVRMDTGLQLAEPLQPRHPDATREYVHLSAVEMPGAYELRLTYAPDGLEGEPAGADSPWDGHRFICPAIRIEAQPAPDENGALDQ